MGEFIGVVLASRPHWWPRASSWTDVVVGSARADDVTTVLVAGHVVASGGRTIVGGDHEAVDAAARRIRAIHGWG